MNKHIRAALTLTNLCLGAALLGCGGDGAQGFQGPQGPQGLQGAQGTAGTPADVGEAVFGRATDDVVINANTSWRTQAEFTTSTGHQQGDYSFRNVTVNPGFTLTLPSSITIRCTGQFSVGAGASLRSLSPFDSIGVSGTAGRSSVAPTVAVGSPGLGQTYTSLLLPAFTGGGGGVVTEPLPATSGGRGGGGISIRARGGISNAGTIDASGDVGIVTFGRALGGGGGGFAILVWGAGSTFTNSGTVNCSGGAGANTAGANTPSGGGGGGGHIRLAGPGAAAVGGNFFVLGGLGDSTGEGAVPNGTPMSSGGPSVGASGLARPIDGTSDTGQAGQLVRTDVTDPLSLNFLGKAL